LRRDFPLSISYLEDAMYKRALGVAVLLGLICAAPARPTSEPESAKAGLLALHQADRRAHFAHDVDALLSVLPPEFIYVRDGKIQMQTKEAIRKRFTEYFQGAEFTAWDDLEPPIVRVSPDGLMGWMIVRVKISYNKTDAAGKKTSEEAVCAWMSTYEKVEGKWVHVANVSTFEW
jgi:ketosteroid isomerase-like protein